MNEVAGPSNWVQSIPLAGHVPSNYHAPEHREVHTPLYAIRTCRLCWTAGGLPSTPAKQEPTPPRYWDRGKRRGCLTARRRHCASGGSRGRQRADSLQGTRSDFGPEQRVLRLGVFPRSSHEASIWHGGLAIHTARPFAKERWRWHSS